jgi:hypothetical protein
MDHDASPPAAGEPLVPPPKPGFDLTVAAVGAGMCALAAVVGLAVSGQESPLPFTATVRLLLVLVGGVTAGSAVSLAPGKWVLWALAAVAAVAGRFGIPDHWDSFRMLAGVLAAVAAAGAVLAALPRTAALGLISAGFLFHFSSIFTATISPPATPWMAFQLNARVFQPYSTFAYLGNAYHFYSPEPGPASHLFFLIYYERYEVDEKTGKEVIDPATGKPKPILDPATGKPKIEAGWETMPRRPEQVKDPLGVSYYRRLALTELVAGTIPDYMTPASFEKSDAYKRRTDVDRGLVTGYPKIPIPYPPDGDPPYSQYRVPQVDKSRYLLPSYARHMLIEYTRPGWQAVRLKLYRLEHRILPPQDYDKRFTGTGQALEPYHPTTYKPFFLGEFDRDGNLVDPQDPMLYWLVPIVSKRPVPGSDDKDYVDYMSKHAGYDYEWRRP